MLPDSNIWVSGFATRGLCADLLRLALRRHGLGNFQLLTCAQVRTETTRVLREKFKVAETDVELVRSAMAFARDVVSGDWVPPPDFPDPDDAPIVGAAIAAEASVLVTGDRALLELCEIGGVAILPPRAVYERLSELG